MRDLEVLFKLILPAVLLIFWALSNLFNREQKAAMARERMPPLGPRPGRPAPSPRDRLSGSPSMAPSRGSSNSNDDILIIRAESTRPAARPPQRRGNPVRGRATQVPPTRRPEPPERPREQLGGRIMSDVSQTIGKPMEVRPLSEQIADRPRGADSGSLPTLSRIEAPLASSLDLLAVMADPAQIRVAVILNEVFQPPVSMRKRAR